MSGGYSFFSFVKTPNGVIVITITILVCLAVLLILKITKLNIFTLLIKVVNWLLYKSGKMINKEETRYHRDLAIGKINEKRKRVKIYRFLNDLTIDLGLKQQGATPYEFLFIVSVLTLIVTILVTAILFRNFIMILFLFPIFLCGAICILYTKANLAHDRRIEAVIEAENIICNNINNGVVVAVRTNINVIPKEVRDEFKDFLDNIESKNFHIKTALMQLNIDLGSVADKFIKECIVYETEEEHGIVGMFKDIVEVNNINMEMRTKMKRKFEEVKQNFIIGASMIFIFLGCVIAIYSNVRKFYFTTMPGQIILALDLLLLVSEFVYITYLRAQEL